MTLKVVLNTTLHLLCIYHACILVSFEYCALVKLNLMENIFAQNYVSVKCMCLHKKLDKEWKCNLGLNLIQWFFFSALCWIWCILIILMDFHFQMFIVVDICKLTVWLKKKGNQIRFFFFKQFFILSLLWNWKPKSCMLWFWKHLNNSSCSNIRQPIFVEAKHVHCIKWIVARFINSHLCCFNLLKMKRNLLYIRNQSVLRSKHFLPQL